MICSSRICKERSVSNQLQSTPRTGSRREKGTALPTLMPCDVTLTPLSSGTPVGLMSTGKRACLNLYSTPISVFPTTMRAWGNSCDDAGGEVPVSERAQHGTEPSLSRHNAGQQTNNTHTQKYTQIHPHPPTHTHKHTRTQTAHLVDQGTCFKASMSLRVVGRYQCARCPVNLSGRSGSD